MQKLHVCVIGEPYASKGARTVRRGLTGFPEKSGGSAAYPTDLKARVNGR
jgi:hypothetical protein